MDNDPVCSNFKIIFRSLLAVIGPFRNPIITEISAKLGVRNHRFDKTVSPIKSVLVKSKSYSLVGKWQRKRFYGRCLNNLSWCLNRRITWLRKFECVILFAGKSPFLKYQILLFLILISLPMPHSDVLRIIIAV